jgi:hypothetical protein
MRCIAVVPTIQSKLCMYVEHMVEHNSVYIVWLKTWNVITSKFLTKRYKQSCVLSYILHIHFYFIQVTLILLTWRIWWAPNNATKWQMGFNCVFKWLRVTCHKNGCHSGRWECSCTKHVFETVNVYLSHYAPPCEMFRWKEALMGIILNNNWSVQRKLMLRIFLL